MYQKRRYKQSNKYCVKQYERLLFKALCEGWQTLIDIDMSKAKEVILNIKVLLPIPVKRITIKGFLINPPIE